MNEHRYDVIKLEKICQLRAHLDDVTVLRWSDDSLTLCSCGKDGHVYEWSAATWTKVASVANKRFETSTFKFPRARTYEMIGLVLGCIEATFCK